MFIDMIIVILLVLLMWLLSQSLATCLWSIVFLPIIVVCWGLTLVGCVIVWSIAIASFAVLLVVVITLSLAAAIAEPLIMMLAGLAFVFET